MEKLFKILQALGKMSPGLIAHLQKKLRPYNYKKGEHILKIGDTANLILFYRRRVSTQLLQCREKASIQLVYG
jgi:hypothetical protein